VITGSTRLLGIVGWPLGHTLSPALHNFVLGRLGVNVRYVPFPVEDPAALPAALRGLAAAGVIGVNVTIPHKVAAAALCDELTQDANAAGAVNTIRFERGRLFGHDTDIAGFGRVIAERKVVVTERSVLVLGAGGAARAAAVFLARAGALTMIAARTLEKAEQLAKLVAGLGPDVEVVPWEARNEAVKRAALVVNTTPIGMWPRASESPLDMSAPLGPGQAVYDVVYNPVRTRLLERAAESGAATLDGLQMLIHQAFDALEFWTGRRVDRSLAHDVRGVLEGVLRSARAPEGAKLARGGK
jgi:shikimate dehydrogenase